MSQSYQKKTDKLRSLLQNASSGNQSEMDFFKMLKYYFPLPLLNSLFLLVSFVGVYVYIYPCMCVVHMSRWL